MQQEADLSRSTCIFTICKQ